jgi:hypothetical protein
MSTRTEEQAVSTEPTVTDEQLAADPQAFDARLALAYEAWEKATAGRERVRNEFHTAAGDRREWIGKRHLWRRTLAEVEQTVRQMAIAGEPLPASMGFRQTAGDLLVKQLEADAALTSAALAVHEMEAIYARPGNRWQRFFPCTNRDGHIHDSYRGCPTVRFDTPMAWRPDMSGLTVDEAVATLGPALCSVCFASAPVEQKSMTLGQVEQERTRAEREAARAARDEARFVKRLRPDETFRCDHDPIETVAACLEVLRKEVEFRDYYGRGEHPFHREYWEASFLARAVLLAREERQPGTGADQAKIERTIESAVKKNRKEGARI